MVPWLVAVGAATVSVLIVLLVALLRRVRVLSESLEHLQRDLSPVLRELHGGTEEARGRMDHIRRRQEKARMSRAGG